MTTAPHRAHDTTTERVLCGAFALSDKTWTLGCTTGHGQPPRERNSAARHPARLLQEVAQAQKRFGLPESAREQRAALAADRRALLHSSEDARRAPVRQRMHRQGMGRTGAWLVVMAFFGWRALPPRRAVGGGAGGPPTPYQSGARAREPGLTTSGQRQVRGMPTAWAWRWRRAQPERARSGWWRERVGSGGKRWRRSGMVAVTRKVRMARWRVLTTGGVPAGAERQAA